MDAFLYQTLEHGAVVLCGSHRLTHRLRLEYAQQAQRAGKVVWPTPNILTLNNYLAEAFKHQRQLHPAAPRLLNELQTQWIWESIVTRSDKHQLLSPAQAARNALRSWQLLHQYQIPLQEVAAYHNEEAQVFYEWAKTFIQYSNTHQAIDSARLADWIERSQFSPTSPIYFVGFDYLIPAHQALITHWQNGGCEVSMQTAPNINQSARCIALKDSDEELQAAARWSRALIESGAKRIGVVVPDLNANASHVKRIFAGVLNPVSRSAEHEYLAPVAISFSAPLSSYPLAHHALLCLEAVTEGGDVLAWGQLLRSPFIMDCESEAAARATTDIQLRKMQRDQWAADEVSRSCVAFSPKFGAILNSAFELRKEFPDVALPSQWTIYFNQLLNEMGWARGRTLSSDEQQARNKFLDVLAQLSSLDEVTRRINCVAALQLLRSAVQQSRFAPESIDQVINVMDSDTASGMHFDALWVVGLHAGEWPAAPDPDPFIPLELQYQYGVANARADRCMQGAQQKLQRLIGSTKDLVVSWPQHDQDVELRASPLLAQIQQLASSISANDVPRSNVKTLVQTLFQSKPILESIADSQLPPHAGGAVKQGSHIVELQSRCAFRAQAELRLHATAPESPSIGISPLDRGKLIHRVLQDVWNRLGNSDKLHAALQNESALRLQIQQTTDRAAQSLLAPVSPHQQRLLRIEIDETVILVLMLLKYESQREPFIVVRREERETFEVNGLQLKIQPDRLDQLQDGSLLLIDYKTSDNYWAKDWLDLNAVGRPRAPQLPLYALAHSEKLCGIAYAILAPGIAELRGLADRDDIASGIKDYSKRKPKFKMPQVDDWSQLQKHWQEVIHELAVQFKQGTAIVDPLPGECQYCPLTSLCRVKEQSRQPIMEEESNVE